MQHNFKVCGAAATVQPIAQNKITWSSFMPDVYMYVNGRAVDNTGTPTVNATPVATGQFTEFANDPMAFSNPPSGFEACHLDQHPRAGNPWDMGILDKETRGNELRLCDEPDHMYGH